MNYYEEDYLQLSGIQHFAFCPRQWALIHVEQQWQDNILTFQGQELHQRTDDPTFSEKRGDLIITRAVPIASRSLGLNGIADVVEFHKVEEPGVKLKGRSGYWQPTPVEYKLGNPKPTNCDILQLCAQAICLEETFQVTLEIGYIFYGRVRRRLDVNLSQELKDETYMVAQEMHRMFSLGKTPEPRVTKACNKCSLVDICIPQLSQRRTVKEYLQSVLKEN
ncbi:MAG: CRISPR-associated protein Cas4 [Firmicutes bacterium]|nr:CRISPR-associated protein Cas4 [Bacillota bacterium]